MDQLKRQLLECMASSLRDGTMEVEDSEQSAQFMLDHLPSAMSDPHEVARSLELLSAQWPVYEPVKQTFHKRLTGSMDENKIEQVKAKLMQLTSAATST